MKTKKAKIRKDKKWFSWFWLIFWIIIFFPIAIIYILIKLGNKLENKNEMNKKQQLKGIRGWLLFYIVIAIISAIYFIIPGVLNLLQAGMGLGLFSFILFFSAIIFGGFWLYTIFMIIQKKKKAINMTIYLLLVGIVLEFIFLLNNLTNIFYFLIDIVLYISFIFYFKKSLRVKKTLIK